MTYLRDLIQGRIVREEKREKYSIFTLWCSTAGCANTCKVSKKKNLPGRCKRCAVLGTIRSPLVLKHKNFISRVERTKGDKPRYWFFCHKCKVETSPRRTSLKADNILCAKCLRQKKPFERKYNALKRTAKKRGLICSLTYNDYIVLVRAQRCTYCGENLPKRSAYKADGGSVAHHIDRRDSNLGYTKENSVPCCATCNSIKMHWFNDKQFAIVRAIYDQNMDRALDLLQSYCND